MRVDDMRQRAEERRRYLDGFAHHLLVCAGLGCQGNEEIVAALNRAVNDVIADPQFVEKAQAIGMEPRGGTPEQLAKFIQVEADRWLPVLQSLNLPKQGR